MVDFERCPDFLLQQKKPLELSLILADSFEDLYFARDSAKDIPWLGGRDSSNSMTGSSLGGDSLYIIGGP